MWFIWFILLFLLPSYPSLNYKLEPSHSLVNTHSIVNLSVETPFTCGLSPASGYSLVLVKFLAAVLSMPRGTVTLSCCCQRVLPSAVLKEPWPVFEGAVTCRRCRCPFWKGPLLSWRGPLPMKVFMLAARGICWVKPLLFVAVSSWLFLAVC